MYRTVESSTYADPKLRKLPQEGKFLFVYLLTNEVSHATGIYHAPYVLVASQTGISEKKVRELLDELEALGLVLHDDETEVVWVVNMLKYQVRSWKVKESMIRHVKGLHCSRLVLAFLEYYPEEFEGIKGYEELLNEKRDMHIRNPAYAYPENGIRISGQSETDGYVSVPVPAPAPVPSPSSDTEKDNTTTTDSSSSKTVPQLRRFSDKPENLVELWNERAPVRYARVNTITPELKVAIKQAFKQLPERREWEEIIDEIAASTFLRDKRFVTLPWVIKTSKGELQPNYMKVRDGNYRDNRGVSLSNREQKTLDAARRFLERNGHFDQPALGEHIDGEEGPADLYSESGDVSDGKWGGSDGRPDGNLLPGSGGLPVSASAPGADLGEEEPDPFPEDRRAEDVY